MEEIKEESKLVEETEVAETTVEEEVVETTIAAEETESIVEQETTTEVVETTKVPTWKIVTFVGMLCVVGIAILYFVYRIVRQKKQSK